jgi:hypothetical protein
MSAEITLIQFPIFCERKFAAPIGQLANGCRGFLYHDFHHAGVGQVVSLLYRIDKMLFPCIFRIGVTHHGINAAGGEHGMRVQVQALTDHDYFYASLVCGNGSSQAGRSRTNDQYIRDRCAVSIIHSRFLS